MKPHQLILLTFLALASSPSFAMDQDTCCLLYAINAVPINCIICMDSLTYVFNHPRQRPPLAPARQAAAPTRQTMAHENSPLRQPLLPRQRQLSQSS